MHAVVLSDQFDELMSQVRQIGGGKDSAGIGEHTAVDLAISALVMLRLLVLIGCGCEILRQQHGR